MQLIHDSIMYFRRDPMLIILYKYYLIILIGNNTIKFQFPIRWNVYVVDSFNDKVSY